MWLHGHLRRLQLLPGQEPRGAGGRWGRRRRATEDADHTVRLLRNHGEEAKSVHEVIGYCNRLHNLQAGFLLAKLPHLLSGTTLEWSLPGGMMSC